MEYMAVSCPGRLVFTAFCPHDDGAWYLSPKVSMHSAIGSSALADGMP